MHSFSTAIIRKNSAEEIVGHRDRALELYRRGLEMIGDAMRLQKHIGGQYCAPTAIFNSRQIHWHDVMDGKIDRSVNLLRKELDGDVWQHVRDVLGPRNLMDAAAIADFNQQIEKDPPVVTRDNLVATFEQMLADSQVIFRRGVVNVFAGLDRSYTTNKAFKIGDKIILSYALSSCGWWDSSSRAADKLFDLDRIFHIVDGKEPHDRHGKPPADRKAEEAPDRSLSIVTVMSQKQAGATIVSDYFEIKLFLNRNMHLRFRRPDLVVEINKIIAEHFGNQLADARPQGGQSNHAV